LKALDAAPALGPGAGVVHLGLDEVQLWIDRGAAP
jgi:hypothetical protein